MRLETLSLGMFSRLTVLDLLRLTGCLKDKRLKHFLDLQLKLYSQHAADCTSALYGATVLQMAQEPLGLWHLKGSMQCLSEQLKDSLLRDGGNLLLRNKVISLQPGKLWGINVINANGNQIEMKADDVIFSLP